MKRLVQQTVALVALSVVGVLRSSADNPAPGWVDFGKLPPPAAGAEYVEVQVRSNLIAMVARLAERAEPSVADALRGLQAVRVNVIGLTDDNRAEVEKRVHALRSELDAAGWERLVTVQNSKEDLGVFIKLRGDEAVQGLAVTIIDNHKEAVLVNIVGDIRPDKVAMVAEQLNIEPLKKVGGALKKHKH